MLKFVVLKYDDMKPKEVPQSKVTLLNENLEELFDFASPNSLRRSIHHVLFNYLIEKEKFYPGNFHTIVTDF